MSPSLAALCPPLDHFMWCVPCFDACRSVEHLLLRDARGEDRLVVVSLVNDCYYSTLQYAVKYNTLQDSIVPCSTVRYNVVQCSALPCSAVQCESKSGKLVRE